MSSANASSADQDQKSYITGFILAVILTAIPFGMVASHAFSKSAVIGVIVITALIQVFVHLRFFLHLGLSGDQRLNTLTTFVTLVLLSLMLGGSFWIMTDLHHRM